MGDGLIDAAVRCVARWGLAKTSLDDVAREAGCSRATVYRSFPGGKDALFAVVARTEVERFLDRIARRVTEASGLEDALVAAITEAGRTLRGHAALQHLVVHEPEVVLPHVAFRQLDELLASVRHFGAPLLAPFLGGDEREADAARLAEWAARVTLSYTLSPSAAVDTTDDASVRRLVRTYVLPGVAASQPQPVRA
jgi:AcrR family transcriptional regulator